MKIDFTRENHYTLYQEEKLLVPSMFSFCHNSLKSGPLEEIKNHQPETDGDAYHAGH